MRKLSLTVVALAGFSTGCTSTGNQTGDASTPYGLHTPNGASQNSYANLGGTGGANPYSGAPAPNTAQQVSFTQKITKALTTNPFASNEAKAPQMQPKLQPPVDPILQGYDSGQPPTPQLYVSMAEMSDRGGNSEQARLLYQRALSVEQGNVDAMLGLAHLEDREGNLDEALKIYQHTASLHPKNPRALNDLGLCLARRGDMQTSLQVLDQAVRLQPEKPLYRNNIAKVLIEMNMINPALSHLAAVHGPAVAEYNVSVLLNQRGRKAEAIQHLHTALQLDPQLQPARTLLSELAPQQPAANQPGQMAQQPAASPSSTPTPGQAAPAPQYGTAPQIARAPQPGPAAYQAQPTQGQRYQTQPPSVNVPGAYSPTPMGQPPYSAPTTR